jgi:activator of HSP90 ATPase
MSRPIRQSVTFGASPHEVYEVLMDSRKHAKIAGAGAKISRKIGGKFTAHDGYISGANLELVPDRKIVQSWHAIDWPADHISRVVFRLSRVKGGTRLTFSHVGVPDNEYASIKQGWIDNYWEPMKRMLDKK